MQDLKSLPSQNPRISEIAEILALGVVRLRVRQSSELARRGGESSLDCVGDQSGDANPENMETG